MKAKTDELQDFMIVSMCLCMATVNRSIKQRRVVKRSDHTVTISHQIVRYKVSLFLSLVPPICHYTLYMPHDLLSVTRIIILPCGSKSRFANITLHLILLVCLYKVSVNTKTLQN